MNKNQEERLFTLMAHAEDLQRVAGSSLNELTRVIERLEKSTPEAIRAVIEKNITQTMYSAQNGLQKASSGLFEASAQAKATSSFLKSAGWKVIGFLVIAFIVLSLLLWAAMLGMNKSRLAELDELKIAIKTEKATLADLQSKTWQMELVEYDDGTRGVIFPKGTKIERATKVKDGRPVAVIR